VNTRLFAAIVLAAVRGTLIATVAGDAGCYDALIESPPPAPRPICFGFCGIVHYPARRVGGQSQVREDAARDLGHVVGEPNTPPDSLVWGGAAIRRR
jgi:hypothetical protein